MRFEEMIRRPADWLSGDGLENEIVLSSRVRLARNLAGHRFTHNAGGPELEEILGKVREAADGSETFQEGLFLAMGELGELDRQFLVERHLVSREFLFNSTHRGLLVNRGQDVCLMINEEDHLRMQAFAPGFDVDSAFEKVDRLDTELSKRLDFAFNERLGFLTACPTNLGTGMRVSVLIHLPGLVHTKEIHKLLESLRKLHHSIRGLYGEGSEVMGNLFQLSNSVTLGHAEGTILGQLREMVGKVIEYEKKARDMLWRKARSLLEDKIWRAYGLLRYARSVSTKEALSLASAVRMGVGMGIIQDLSIRQLNEILLTLQPAHLQKRVGQPLDPQERDVARAEYIRRAVSAGT
jgi:protein arginine kinase